MPHIVHGAHCFTMMEVIMVLIKFAFTCAATLIVNQTDTWTAVDRKAVEVAAKRCVQLYPDAPCLVKFVKLEEQRYNAYCGVDKK